jgi:putative PIN family toxin of toxin-antitoxin system
MRVVIDTNCFLAIIPKLSPYRPIFDSFRRAKFELAISTEILNEYSEIFTEKMTPEISENLLELILKQPNSIHTEIFYRWGLIHVDYDDNKFVDTAISSISDYVVTVDGHFKILKDIPFPKVIVLNLNEFLEIIEIMNESNL